MSETNEGVVTAPEAGEGEGKESEVETIAIPKTEYEKLNQTIGSMKRQIKDLSKPKDEPKETPEQTKPDDSALIQKLERISLRQAGIDHPEDVDLARKTAKKWNVDIDEVLADDDFKAKLERQQTARSNADATTNLKGGAGASQAKFTPEYWIAKGSPPSATDVPDRKVRSLIARAMMANTKSSKKFYND